MNLCKLVRTSAVVLAASLVMLSCNALLAILTYTENEGSASGPVVLTVGGAHGGKVGASAGSRDTSYYTFTVQTSGLYTVLCENVVPSGTDLDFSFYDTEDFSWASSTITEGNRGIPKRYYAAGTYYMTVVNSDSSSSAKEVQYDLTVRLDELGNPNEGSVATPVLLTVGTTHEGRIGGDSGSYENSYYSFTIASAGTYTIVCSNRVPTSTDLGFYLYSNADFSSLIVFSDSESGIAARSFTAGTYYLRVYNWYSSNVTYDLTVQ